MWLFVDFTSHLCTICYGAQCHVLVGDTVTLFWKNLMQSEAFNLTTGVLGIYSLLLTLLIGLRSEPIAEVLTFLTANHILIPAFTFSDVCLLTFAHLCPVLLQAK